MKDAHKVQAQPDPNTDRMNTMNESELKAAIQAAKDRRDSLPRYDVRWYDAQYEVYQLNQDLMWLQKAKRRG